MFLFYKKVLTVVLLIIVAFTFTTYTTQAALTTTFGGRSVSLIPCTGSGSTVPTVNFFVPLYLNSVPVTGFMGVPYAINYSSYVIAPGSAALGTYIPAAAVCIIGVCPYCVYIPNYGMILPMTGSSI